MRWLTVNLDCAPECGPLADQPAKVELEVEYDPETGIIHEARVLGHEVHAEVAWALLGGRTDAVWSYLDELEYDAQAERGCAAQ